MNRRMIFAASSVALVVVVGGALYLGSDARGKCGDRALKPMLLEYDDLMRRGRSWDAARLLQHCAEARPKRKDLSRLVAEAEIWSHEQTIGSSNSTPHDKLRAIAMLERDHPAAGAKFASQRDQLRAEMNRTQQVAKAAAPPVTAAPTGDPVDALTTYAVVLGRALGCGLDTADASARVGRWMDQAFPPGSPGQGTYLAIMANGMRMHAIQQREGKSPDSCSAVQRSFASFPWP